MIDVTIQSEPGLHVQSSLLTVHQVPTAHKLQGNIP